MMAIVNRKTFKVMISTLLLRIKKNTTLSENYKIKYKIVTRGNIDTPNTQIHDL